MRIGVDVQPTHQNAKADYTTQSIFFLCFDFSFEVNRYLVLFGSITTVPYCCGCRSLIESLGVVSIAHGCHTS
jgi:hypothetical protein